jgi:hypothetical protein
MKTRSLVCTIVATIFILVFTATVWAATTAYVLPIQWSAANTSLYYQEITTTPEDVIDLPITKVMNVSALKVSFSGGFLAFSPDGNGKASQAMVQITIDGVPYALNVDYSAGIARNTYPTLSTVFRGIAKGNHIVSVSVSKTADEGYLTYTTQSGEDPDTIQAVLVVEEWLGNPFTQNNASE